MRTLDSEILEISYMTKYFAHISHLHLGFVRSIVIVFQQEWYYVYMIKII